MEPESPEQPEKQMIQPRNFGRKRPGEEEPSKKLKLDDSRHAETGKTEPPPPARTLREPGAAAPSPPPPSKPAGQEFFIAPGRGGVPVSKKEIRRRRDRTSLTGKNKNRQMVIVLPALVAAAVVAGLWIMQPPPPQAADATEPEQAETVLEQPLELAEASPTPEPEEAAPMDAAQQKLQPYLERLEPLQAAGNSAEIERVFRDAAAETSNLPLFWLRMGVLHYTHLRSEEKTNAEIIPLANPFFERAMRHGSELPVVLSHSSTYFVETGQINEGLKTLQRLAELRPTDAAALQQLAFTQMASGRSAEGAATMQQLIAINPGEPRTRLAYANLLEESGRFEDASEAYRIYHSLNPDDTVAVLRHARILGSQLGRLDGARALLERAVESHPDDLNLQVNYAVALLESKKHEGALAAFERAEELLPEETPESVRASIWIGKGSAMYSLGQIEAAEEMFSRAYETAPGGENPDASNNLAYIWLVQSKNAAEALGMAEQALEAQPDNPSYRHTYAKALFQQGKTDEALTHLEQAFDNSPEPSHELLETLGDVHAALGGAEKSQEFYKQALAIVPENESLRAKVTE